MNLEERGMDQGILRQRANCLGQGGGERRGENENGGVSPVRRSAFDRMRRGKGRKGGFRGSGICAHLR